MNDKYVEIGKVVNTFGIKGELKIQSESDFIDYRFAVGKIIYFKMGRIIKEFKVSSYRVLKGNVVITINDQKDINLGDVELLIALHKVFNLEKDKLLIDVGHQAYTHKILTGRADKFSSLRQFNGLSGFLCNEESKYDVFESGHSSTSISTAMGMALAKEIDKEDYEIISLIGDASIVNGVSFEALIFSNISS